MANLKCNECGFDIDEFMYDMDEVRELGCPECDSHDLDEEIQGSEYDA